VAVFPCSFHWLPKVFYGVYVKKKKEPTQSKKEEATKI
jgi:hypothetical protein